MAWDTTAPLCGNCRWWVLSSYQERLWSEGTILGSRPSGAGGHHCSGDVSECRAGAPQRDGDRDRDLSGSARWPTTKPDDWCRIFKPRGGFGSVKAKG